jgi:ATP-dependent Clp protease ATP-binding subunit ClpC
MEEKFSKRVQLILKYAKEEAQRYEHGYVGSDHLLLGIIRDSVGKAANLLITLGTDLDTIKNQLVEAINSSGGTMTIGHLPLTRRAERVLKNTYIEAKNMGYEVADDLHLLLAISLEEDGIASKTLKQLGIDSKLLMTYIQSIEKNPNVKLESPKKSKTPTLDMYSRDISKMALDGHLDPVIGRINEIERVAQILSRRKKNNPVLIGEPGVGKTAIIEGLALRILDKSVPRILWDQRVVSLDLAGLIAGTKYRGQFEERMRTLIIELESTSEVIIFIDELHTIVGAGGATGSLDAANMFKPALARGDIQIVGATTLGEYRKHVEKDGALERRFQKVIINPPTLSDTLTILEGLKEKYEEHHLVKYSKESLKSCVEMSDKYISDKFLPDKAIDVMDEVGARVHIHNIFVPDSIVKFEKSISKIRKQKETAIVKQKFEEAASLRDKERKLKQKLDDLQKNLTANKLHNRPIVTEEEVANVIAMTTGIPVNKIAQSESEKLMKMNGELNKFIIGQDTAINKLTQSILRARVGLNNPNHPIGSFMFLGPTGVGKTELAKVLANYLFNNKDSLIKIDMSEYMERHNVSRLIGAPPGYIGYEEGGQLTERVRRNPYSIVLFDEIEKAHRDVFNILLQILDEGRITDSLGRLIDFRNTIIILTSNIGTSNMHSSKIGFSNDYTDTGTNSSKSDIMSSAQKTFKPEFLNRLDEIIVFNQLTVDDLLEIVDIQLSDIVKNLLEKDVRLFVSKHAKQLLISEGSHREWGARPLRRVIQSMIETEISQKFLTGKFINGGKISINTKNNELVFTQTFLKRKTKRKTTKT